MTTLNKLLHQIHAVKNKAEMQSSLTEFKTKIRNIVTSGGFEEENYFINHTGRELFRQLNRFDMQNEIKDSVDSGFRPIRKTKLSNLNLNFLSRFDASVLSSIVHEANKVKEWVDLTSNQNSVSPPNHTAKKPLTNAKTQNHLNVIDFDGNDSLSKMGFEVPQSGNINFFVVFSATEVDSEFDSIISLDAEDHDFQFDAADDKMFKGRVSAKNLGGANTLIPAGQLSGFNIGHVFFNFDIKVGTNWHIGKQYGLRVNGKMLGQKYQDRVYVNKLNEIQELKIFSNRSGNNSPKGSIGEILITENLNTEQKEGIEGYLAHKWGLLSKLETSHPYKNYLYKFFEP